MVETQPIPFNSARALELSPLSDLAPAIVEDYRDCFVSVLIDEPEWNVVAYARRTDINPMQELDLQLLKSEHAGRRIAVYEIPGIAAKDFIDPYARVLQLALIARKPLAEQI